MWKGVSRVKKIRIGLLCAVLLFLSACGQAPEAAPEYSLPTTQTTAEPTTELPTTTTEPPTITPGVWPDAPQAYWPLLDGLSNTVWPGCHPRDFAVADINSDGIPELVLRGCCQMLVALYTLQDDEPVRLAIGGASRFGFSLAADGTVLGTTAQMGPFTLHFHKLEPGAAELTRLSVVHISFDEEGFWHENTDGYVREITEEEYWELEERHSNPPNPMPLEFIPIIVGAN